MLNLEHDQQSKWRSCCSCLCFVLWLKIKPWDFRFYQEGSRTLFSETGYVNKMWSFSFSFIKEANKMQWCMVVSQPCLLTWSLSDNTVISKLDTISFSVNIQAVHNSVTMGVLRWKLSIQIWAFLSNSNLLKLNTKKMAAWA